ncbi:MAG: sulfurtransferase complex subunit TusB [Alphaproteobacteria bacterium]|nr:sulfurtransferase complex subunit TusB [Alphaproteobacteria bacterium]
MSTLHTVNKSPFATNALASCLNHAKDGDTILLIEDGVYGAATGTTLADTVTAKVGALSICVLSGDISARGIDQKRLIKGVTSVDYTGFVKLAASHDRSQAWL